jgi:hypothetical protein
MEGTFAALLDDARKSLETWIETPEQAVADHLPARVYEAGRAVGLTDREITLALVRPVRGQLRPGLTRQ